MSKFCTNCGSEVIPLSKFCTKCGAKIINITEPIKVGEPDKVFNIENNHLQVSNIDEREANSFSNRKKSYRQDDADNLYKNGMDIIISSSILFSTPFIVAGKQIVDQFEILKNETAESLSADLIRNIPLDQFLADFYKYSNAFVERVTQYFSDIIRKHTKRNDIKEKTSERISDEIRKESFKKFDEVFSNYIVTMQELGVQLESVSSIKSAVQGTFIGGGLQLMGSKGKSSGAGMVAGALIGAAIAEGEKIELRKRLLKASFDGIKEIIETLPICNQKLMDQYSSYIFGSNIDFSERDKQINRGKNILNDIKSNCTVIFDSIVTGNSFWSDASLKIGKAQKGKKIEEFYGFGCLGYIAAAIILVIFGLDTDSGTGQTLIMISFFGYLILPLAFFIRYNLYTKKEEISKQVTKILDEIKLKKSDYQHLENSLQKLYEYKSQISFEFAAE